MALENQYKVFNMDSNNLNKKMFVDSMIPNPQQQQQQQTKAENWNWAKQPFATEGYEHKSTIAAKKVNSKFSSKKMKNKAFEYFNSQGAIVTTTNQGAKAASVGDGRGYQNTCSDQERSIDCNSDKVMMKLPSDNEELINENPKNNYWGNLPEKKKKRSNHDSSNLFSVQMAKG